MVKQQKQLLKHDPENRVWGDCHRTALAALFGMDAKDVPHFNEGGPDPDEFKRRERAWLLTRGFKTIEIAFECTLKILFEIMAINARGAFWLLGGTSRNGSNHTVLCKGGKIVCDPSQNDSSIVAPLDVGYYVATFLVPSVYR
jgi:hypothetical protein